MTRALRITGAQVFDGTGADPRNVDVRIVGDALQVDPQHDGTPETVLDAGGLALAPGFIDVHTHSDALAFDASGDPRLASASVLGGVTTEIAGNCGSSLFPVESHRHAAVSPFLKMLFGNHSAPCTDYLTFHAAHGRVPRYTNITSLIGLSTVRAAVLGFENRPATPVEVDQMCRLLHKCLLQGAAGISSGLIYPPGTFADTDELVALASVAAKHGKPYVTHLRDEMSGVEAALQEAIDMARRSSVALHISHHKTAGLRGHGRSGNTLDAMDAARASGIDLTCDVYPYTAGSTHLHALLPPSANSGGLAVLLQRLASISERSNIRQAIDVGETGWENTVGNGGWHLIEIASAPTHPAWVGQTIEHLALNLHTDPVDLVADLLIAEQGAVTVISHSMDEADVRRILRHPGTMIGSDGVPQGSRPHPRWAGTFTRVLGRYTREFGDLTVADAIARMTGLSAARFGLRGRGVIADGAVADLVLFDPTSVADRATFTDSLLPPVGIQSVFVSGRAVVADGGLTGVMPGAPL